MGQQGFGKSRSYTKEQQGQRIVHSNHSQQRGGEGSFGIVLGQHVHRGGRRGRRSQGAKDERCVKGLG